MQSNSVANWNSILHVKIKSPHETIRNPKYGLMDRQPELAARIQEAARAKLGRALDEPGGDLISEELSNAPSE